VAFENGSRVGRIEDCACSGSGLKSILIPSSVVVLGKSSFYECSSLESVTFESGSRLERIEESAFSNDKALRSIVIPSSVKVLERASFATGGGSFSVVFETGSRLERINDEWEPGGIHHVIGIPFSQLRPALEKSKSGS
jgi:hypothetical protein